MTAQQKTRRLFARCRQVSLVGKVAAPLTLLLVAAIGGSQEASGYGALDWILGRTPWNAGPDRHLIDAVIGGGIGGFNYGLVNSTSDFTGVGMGGGFYDPFAVDLGTQFGTQPGLYGGGFGADFGLGVGGGFSPYPYESFAPQPDPFADATTAIALYLLDQIIQDRNSTTTASPGSPTVDWTATQLSPSTPSVGHSSDEVVIPAAIPEIGVVDWWIDESGLAFDTWWNEPATEYEAWDFAGHSDYFFDDFGLADSDNSGHSELQNDLYHINFGNWADGSFVQVPDSTAFSPSIATGQCVETIPSVPEPNALLLLLAGTLTLSLAGRQAGRRRPTDGSR